MKVSLVWDTKEQFDDSPHASCRFSPRSASTPGEPEVFENHNIVKRR
jgi:hypothetical protein